MNKQCEKQVPDGGRWLTFHQCTRKAKEQRDGKWLCGQHIAVIERRERKDREWRERADTEQAHKEYLNELSAKHGISINPEYLYFHRKYSLTEVVVNLEDLKKLLGQDERLRKEADRMRSKTGRIERFIVANRILHALDPEES